MRTNNVFFSFVLNVKILSNLIFSFFKVKLDKLCVISAESVCQQFDVPLLIISYIDVKTLLSPYDIWSMLNSHPFSKDYPTKGRSKWRLEAAVWAVFIWASSAASSPDCVGWDGRRSAATSLPLVLTPPASLHQAEPRRSDNVEQISKDAIRQHRCYAHNT